MSRGRGAEEMAKLHKLSRKADRSVDPMDRARQNPRSRQIAIRAKCWDCSGQSFREAKQCVVTGCPLWAFRPGAGEIAQNCLTEQG